MKTFTISATLASILISTAHASTLQQRDLGLNAGDIHDAVIKWHDDTEAVSAFLNSAADIVNQALNNGQDSIDITSIANTAFGRETDEPNQKHTIELNFCPHLDTIGCNPDQLGNGVIDGANATLITDGTFISVVNALQTLSSAPAGTSAQLAKAQLDLINNGNGQTGGRCQAVLPAIDLYFQQVNIGLIMQNGDRSLSGVHPVPPSACGSGGVPQPSVAVTL
ncbi:hypothetical protein LTR15_008653 [Elasticomyces elasticus]|nr:hypothetical protein LTR15_008653 [Elasticomyces elasticus]